MLEDVRALLIDLDGVLYVEEEPIAGAAEAVRGLRERGLLGKPAKGLFEQVLASVGVDASAAAMVGDDIESDIGGALRAGLDAILVRTGKYREDRLRESASNPPASLTQSPTCPRYSAPEAPEVHSFAEDPPRSLIKQHKRGDPTTELSGHPPGSGARARRAKAPAPPGSSIEA